MACHLFSYQPLSESMQANCELGYLENIRHTESKLQSFANSFSCVKIDGVKVTQILSSLPTQRTHRQAMVIQQIWCILVVSYLFIMQWAYGITMANITEMSCHTQHMDLHNEICLHFWGFPYLTFYHHPSFRIRNIIGFAYMKHRWTKDY